MAVIMAAMITHGRIRRDQNMSSRSNRSVIENNCTPESGQEVDKSMAAIIQLPSARPTGDDQEWKRQVAETLRQLKAHIEALESQLGKR